MINYQEYHKFNRGYHGHVTADSMRDIPHPRFSYHWKRGVRQVFAGSLVIFCKVNPMRKWRGDARSNHTYTPPEERDVEGK